MGTSTATAGRSQDSPSSHISWQARRHAHMRREVLARHPELRALAGPDWRYALALPPLLAMHWGMAWFVGQTDVLTCFVAAFVVGQFVLHSAAALLHESAHRLICRGYWSKLAVDSCLELILASYGKQLTYQHDHVSSHHRFLGDYERDYEHEDACRFMARRIHARTHPRRQRLMLAAELAVHLLPLGFLIAGEIFPRVYRQVTGHGTKDTGRSVDPTRPTAQERIFFIVLSAGANIVLVLAFGWLALLYHVWSLSIFLGKWGISNLGQSLSEHPGDDEVAPTRSDYSWVNRALFNSGYHNEHHTFPNVAGSRLPQLRRMAPETFCSASEKSYFTLWWEHVRNDFSPSRRSPILAQERSARCR